MRFTKFFFLSAFLLVHCSQFAANEAPCRDAGSHLLVKADKHRMYLCQDSKLVASYSVRLPSKGMGKKREGDKKLPLGTYSLGLPRGSEKFGIFIPVGYPTEEQRRQGYTGGSIGIHGPIRWARILGRLVNWFDTTSGCVGLATDREMEVISRWVKENRISLIRIEP